MESATSHCSSLPTIIRTHDQIWRKQLTGSGASSCKLGPSEPACFTFAAADSSFSNGYLITVYCETPRGSHSLPPVRNSFTLRPHINKDLCLGASRIVFSSSLTLLFVICVVSPASNFTFRDSRATCLLKSLTIASVSSISFNSHAPGLALRTISGSSPGSYHVY